jgi:hypothetical protein
MDWIYAHWGYIATFLFMGSEIIGESPSVSNSLILGPILKTVKALTKEKAREQIDKDTSP